MSFLKRPDRRYEQAARDPPCAGHVCARLRPRRPGVARFAAVTAASPVTPASPADPPACFIFGLGYTGLALSRHLVRSGWAVAATARSRSRLLEAGVDLSSLQGLFEFDPAGGKGLDAQGTAALTSCSHVVSTIPPLALPMYDPVLSAQLALLRAHPAGGARWLGYLSSTSVYGDWQGGWVDEGSPLRTASSRGLVRAEAERAWVAACSQQRGHGGGPLHVFRLGGIYGPGRSVLEALRLEGGAAAAAGSSSQQRRAAQRFTSRCHVYDICQCLLASMAAPCPEGGVFNVVDDEPAPRSEVMDFARQLLAQGNSNSSQGPEAAPVAGTSAPQRLQSSAGASSSSSSNSGSGSEGAQNSSAGGAAGSSSSSSRGAVALEEKRVRNGRIKEQLGVRLRHPTYREGIQALCSGDLAPFNSAADVRALTLRGGSGGET